MKISPITSDEEHQAAVRAIAALWDAPEDSAEGKHMDALVTLVDAYESRRWPVEALEPIDALKAEMDLGGRSQADLANVLGSQSRASEILSRTRPLTLDMIRAIEREWGIPAQFLVAKYDLRKSDTPRRTPFASSKVSKRRANAR